MKAKSTSTRTAAARLTVGRWAARALCAGFLCLWAAHAAAAPNVVVIMADDQPVLDGRLLQVLPHVRQTFIDHGLTFTDFHSETPLCCPARAGFLTGQHTFNHGVVWNDATLFDPSMTLATQLQAAGYYTI